MMVSFKSLAVVFWLASCAMGASINDYGRESSSADDSFMKAVGEGIVKTAEVLSKICVSNSNCRDDGWDAYCCDNVHQCCNLPQYIAKDNNPFFNFMVVFREPTPAYAFITYGLPILLGLIFAGAVLCCLCCQCCCFSCYGSGERPQKYVILTNDSMPQHQQQVPIIPSSPIPIPK